MSLFDRFRKDKKPGLPAIRKNWESCTGETNVTPEPLMPHEWSPMDFAVKIMVAGDLQHSQDVAQAVSGVQAALSEQFNRDFPNTTLLMNVETFLDDCRHSTGWSSNPLDIGGTATRWHCFQTNSRFFEAFRELRTSWKRDADLVIMIGNRFDDNLEQTVAETRKLFEQKKTKIFALPITGNSSVNNAYRQIAEGADGLSLQLQNPSADTYRQAVGEIVQHTFAANTGKLLALPAPDGSAAKEIRLALEDKQREKVPVNAARAPKP